MDSTCHTFLVFPEESVLLWLSAVNLEGLYHPDIGKDLIGKKDFLTMEQAYQKTTNW